MKRIIILLLGAMAGTISAIAQNDSFESFRKSIKNDFGAFRDKVLNDYDKYLDGVWAEYNAFRGLERDSVPKPVKIPVADSNPEVPFTKLPVPEIVPEQLPHLPEPAPTIPFIPAPPAKPSPRHSTFDFYGMPVQVPEINFATHSEKIRTKDFATLWRLYTDCKAATQILPALQQYAAKWNLNDWFIFELIRSYTGSVLSAVGAEARISLEHHLLNHWGYNARIGIESTGCPILLIAIKQTVYARTYTVIDGQKYYMFSDDQCKIKTNAGCMFKTCQLPRDAEKGKSLDLIIYRDLTIPYSPHSYSFSYKEMKIEGEVNANLMPMLYHYPQTSIGCYAASTISQHTRNDVIEQLHHQLSDMPQLQAVNKLLQFIQHAFEYATDDEQHGFEKPYFFEEMLFYPQCDCEDRSIFYSYLLKHLLKVGNQLVGYPGHEAVAVCLDEAIQGDNYSYKGKTYYISDPTYIGAKTGMCMPSYQNVQPVIDYSWESPE